MVFQAASVSIRYEMFRWHAVNRANNGIQNPEILYLENGKSKTVNQNW